MWLKIPTDEFYDGLHVMTHFGKGGKLHLVMRGPSAICGCHCTDFFVVDYVDSELGVVPTNEMYGYAPSTGNYMAYQVGPEDIETRICESCRRIYEQNTGCSLKHQLAVAIIKGRGPKPTGKIGEGKSMSTTSKITITIEAEFDLEHSCPVEITAVIERVKEIFEEEGRVCDIQLTTDGDLEVSLPV